MLCKSFVLLYYCILKCILNDNLNLRHQSQFTHFEKSQSMVRAYSAEKKLTSILSAKKYYTLAFISLTHLVYNELSNHHLFSISINFTRKFCYWHRRKSSRFFLRESCSKRFRKNFQELIPSECNFHKVIRW